MLLETERERLEFVFECYSSANDNQKEMKRVFSILFFSSSHSPDGFSYKQSEDFFNFPFSSLYTSIFYSTFSASTK